MSSTSMAQRASIHREASDSRRQAILTAVAAYIPSESLAFYLLLVGLFAPSKTIPTKDVATVLLYGFFVTTVIAWLIIFATYDRHRSEGRLTATWRKFVLAVMATIALYAYVLATPGGPFDGTTLSFANSLFGVALAAALLIVLPIFASFVGLDVPARRKQAIAFAPLSDVPLSTLKVALSSVTVTSGLDPEFEASGACEVAVEQGQPKIVLLNPGTCEVTATQGGSSVWAPAKPVKRSFNITAS